MPLNYAMPSSAPTQEQMGMPDYGKYIQTALANNSAGLDLAYKPKNLAEALLAQQLQNKIKGVEAKYAPQTASANLDLIKAKILLLL